MITWLMSLFGVMPLVTLFEGAIPAPPPESPEGGLTAEQLAIRNGLVLSEMMAKVAQDRRYYRAVAGTQSLNCIEADANAMYKVYGKLSAEARREVNLNEFRGMGNVAGVNVSAGLFGSKDGQQALQSGTSNQRSWNEIVGPGQPDSRPDAELTAIAALLAAQAAQAIQERYSESDEWGRGSSLLDSDGEQARRGTLRDGVSGAEGTSQWDAEGGLVGSSDGTESGRIQLGYEANGGLCGTGREGDVVSDTVRGWTYVGVYNTVTPAVDVSGTGDYNFGSGPGDTGTETPTTVEAPVDSDERWF